MVKHFILSVKSLTRAEGVRDAYLLEKWLSALKNKYDSVQAQSEHQADSMNFNAFST